MITRGDGDGDGYGYGYGEGDGDGYGEKGMPQPALAVLFVEAVESVIINQVFFEEVCDAPHADQ